MTTVGARRDPIRLDPRDRAEPVLALIEWYSIMSNIHRSGAVVKPDRVRRVPMPREAP
ncbi:hypothetical protein QT381_00130 [Galbitalea sp. SE-J8]|uniref:hypothetical protein n=1 Tax=Galbitalea sp. SE-J8 TaxID=3054952 RepID=UPI00259C8995|nr:hypothetical protein [Galbitalea sp. SE-J8]MDM4761414.1 hypothetical protein [Galbitalea sp. SE-J8]